MRIGIRRSLGQKVKREEKGGAERRKRRTERGRGIETSTSYSYIGPHCLLEKIDSLVDVYRLYELGISKTAAQWRQQLAELLWQNLKVKD